MERAHLPLCSAHSMLRLQIEVQPKSCLAGLLAVSPMPPTVQMNFEMNKWTDRSRAEICLWTPSAIRSERSTAMRERPERMMPGNGRAGHACPDRTQPAISSTTARASLPFMTNR